MADAATYRLLFGARTRVLVMRVASTRGAWRVAREEFGNSLSADSVRFMPLCPACQQPAAKRNGRDRRGRQKYACRPCRRTFTENTVSAFSGYRWSRDVIVMAVRWYLAYPLSSRQVLELLAERGIDVSHRTILTWSQVFGPLLAAEVRRRRRVGKRWFVDEVFLFRKTEKRYLCIGRLTRTARSWTCCYATIATRRVPRRSFARPSSGRSWCPRRSSPITTSRM